jgi:hypothetical protein
MDARQFDGLVRRLTIGASRRRVLGLLLAGGLGGAPSLLQRQEAEARCRPRNRKCGGECCPKGTLCYNPTTHLCASLKDTCDAGDNYCADGTSATKCGGDNCFCWQTFGGKTRCGVAASSCDVCSGDGKCIDIYGAGSFCVKPKVQSGFCGNCAANEGFCATACTG